MFTASNDKGEKGKASYAGPNLSDTVIETAKEKQEDLREAAEKAGRKVRSFIISAEDELSHASDAVRTEIRSNPVRSSLIALGVGFVIGAIFFRR